MAAEVGGDDRQLVTLDMLTAFGGREVRLEVHASLVAKKVFAQRGLLPAGQQPTAAATAV
ncbi:hypothetical protein ABZT48_39305 [Streptomyces avermitilis]|uniref:hypothetical protein n=1 Tax=Streptomyces avermitilis TaxID=33903 RepID=UPI0033A2D8DB